MGIKKRFAKEYSMQEKKTLKKINFFFDQVLIYKKCVAFN